MKANAIRRAVRKSYAAVAKQSGSCCGTADEDLKASSCGMGYTAEEIMSAPRGANMGLGCGNPVAIASLKAGDTVVDLGSGGGFDCFLAAKKVGKKGRIIGVDMTPEMIEKARENAEKVRSANVEFRLGEIEHLPVADNSVDVIISNCVINLAPDKETVLREAYRILKPGGRIAISDLALVKKLPPKLKNSVAAYTGCIGGAIMLDDYKKVVRSAGFRDINVTVNDRDIKAAVADTQLSSPAYREKLKLAESVAECVVSVYINAVKSK